jgi:polyisoprenoid-binding protein YceI
MRIIISVFLVFFLSSLTFAGTWVTNRDHSEVMFQIPYMQVSEVTGRFNEFTGEGQFNEKTNSFDSLVVQIESKTIDTGNKMRDGHLQGSDFLRSSEHPYITFKSQHIVRLNQETLRATGELMVRGIKKAADIEFKMSGSLKDTWGYENRFVKFKTAINRKDFGIRWNKTLDGQQLLIGDIISIWGTFQMQPSNNKTPNSKHMIPDNELMRKNDLERRNGEGKKTAEEESWVSQKLRKLINGK